MSNTGIFTRNLFWRSAKFKFGNYKVVKPSKVSPKKGVPDYIPKPSYAHTGIPCDQIPPIPEIKSVDQIYGMREACLLASKTLKKVECWLEPGVTTDEIDCRVHKECIETGAYPSPLNYKGFPKSICTSINNVACHGIPDDRPLENGDIINVDITVFFNGYHGDCSKTFLIGKVDDEGQKLVNATEKCLYEAISICKPGTNFRDIGACIEKRARNMGFKVIPAFIGHGIGYYFHGPPDIYHMKNDYPGKMSSGMTFTIEPVLTQGDETIDILDDNWTAVTVDSARTAQFEHTVLITEDGVDILTA